jgi:hypothetical protein
MAIQNLKVAALKLVLFQPITGVGQLFFEILFEILLS